jgi:hypothetical protein
MAGGTCEYRAVPSSQHDCDGQIALVNPTNGVGGLFILSLQGLAALLLPLHLTRPPRGHEAGA